jgi:hypothetical protein
MGSSFSHFALLRTALGAYRYMLWKFQLR